MPKINPLIPNELLLEKLDALSGLIQIIPEQVSMIVGLSPSKLKENRANGEPPPFVKEGSSYRYRIEDVRNYLRDKAVFKSTLQMQKHEAEAVYLAFGSFTDFMNMGELADQWPFAVIAGKPVEFFTSLAMNADEEETECEFLTMEQYLGLRHNCEYQRAAIDEKELILKSQEGLNLPSRKTSHMTNK